jgi:tetratricopeptide (TPR) repeat protein
MARFDRGGPKGAKPNAGVAKPSARTSTMAPAIEDTMFFPRLRRHAKWMFVFLALVFAIGFVGFGVGAGGTGIGDILRDSGGTGDLPSVSEARKQTEEQPQDAQAWRDLSTALQTEGQSQEALDALATYSALRPKDVDALREMAGLYLAVATAKQSEAQQVQIAAAYAGVSQSFPGALTVNGSTILDNRIGAAVNSKASTRVTELLTESSTDAIKAVSTYQQIAALQPDDPNVQLELASTAEQAQQADVAIAAYERFLALAPDDPNASIVKTQLKQLKKQVAASASG